MSIATVDDTYVLMDKSYLMVSKASTEVLMNVVNIVDVVDDIIVDGADGWLKKVRVLMHIGADVSLFLNNGHVELEDDDLDVVDVISPLSFKVEMNNLMVSSVILENLSLISVMNRRWWPILLRM